LIGINCDVLWSPSLYRRNKFDKDKTMFYMIFGLIILLFGIGLTTYGLKLIGTIVLIIGAALGLKGSRRFYKNKN